MATQFKQRVKSLRNIQLTESINCAHSTFRSIVCLIIFFSVQSNAATGFLKFCFCASKEQERESSSRYRQSFAWNRKNRIDWRGESAKLKIASRNLLQKIGVKLVFVRLCQLYTIILINRHNFTRGLDLVFYAFLGLISVYGYVFTYIIVIPWKCDKDCFINFCMNTFNVDWSLRFEIFLSTEFKN